MEPVRIGVERLSEPARSPRAGADRRRMSIRRASHEEPSRIGGARSELELAGVVERLSEPQTFQSATSDAFMYSSGVPSTMVSLSRNCGPLTTDNLRSIMRLYTALM